MYRGKSVLCIIPARAGSKGLPGKNIKNLHGKPLIAYTIEQAKNSKYIDRVIVSTESLDIADISRKYGAEVPFRRPAKLATDKSNIMDVLIHAIAWMKKKERADFDIVVLLHVTSPLRTSKDIDKCIEILVKKQADNVFSVTEAHRNPYFNMVEINKDGKVGLVKKGRFINRQAIPKVFDMNASIYVWWKDILMKKKSSFLKNSRIYVMPKEKSVDIDDYLDFKIAEMFLIENFHSSEKFYKDWLYTK